METAAKTPRTVAGLALRAALLKDYDCAHRLSSMLNGGKPGWNQDEPAVVEAACALVLHRFFRPDYDVREVTAYVSDLLARAHESEMRAGHLEIEAVVRLALGDTGVELEGIRPAVLHNIRGIVTMDIADRLDLSKPEIDQMLSDAEQIAFRRGWNPPLATLS
jgi:hypothetical protein